MDYIYQNPTLLDTKFGTPVNTTTIIRRTTDEVRVISHQAGRNLKYDHPSNKGSSIQFRQLQALKTREIVFLTRPHSVTTVEHCYLQAQAQ